MSQRLLLEGADLRELVTEIRNEFGPDARIVKAERVRTGGVGGFFRKEHFEVTVEVRDNPRPGPRELGRAARRAIHEQQVVSAAERASASADLADEVSFEQVLGAVRQMAAAPDLTLESEGVPPLLGPVAPSKVNGGRRVSGVASADVRRDALLSLGVPGRLLVRQPAADGASLSAMLMTPDVAPDVDRSPGAIIAVVTASSAASATAHVIADRVGASGVGQVGVGTSHVSADAVARWREGLAASVVPRVVIVNVGAEPGDASAGAEVLEALRPAQVWAVVDARTKAGDCRAWLAEVGAKRKVDALSVRSLAETSEPGTVLDLGVPVALVDGAPATKVAWLAVLAERIGHETWV